MEIFRACVELADELSKASLNQYENASLRF